MSKAREWSRGWQMPGPRAGQNLQTPHPGTDKAGKCPAVARGKRAQVELTDAQHTFNRFLFIFIFLFIFFFFTRSTDAGKPTLSCLHLFACSIKKCNKVELQ